MSGNRAVLNIRYTPVGPGAGKKAGRLTNYIQNRDNERPEAEIQNPESFMYYAAYRDRAQPEGRMFDAQGTIGTQERLDLVANIRDSIQGAREGDRAFYQMVISPEDARGVDLRALTRATMQQMERDCGRMRWIAAEHRNTEHPHAHVVVAARRENEQGHYKTVVINRPRLERMKEAMTNELSRQHDHTNQMGHEAGPRLGRAVIERSLNRTRSRCCLALSTAPVGWRLRSLHHTTRRGPQRMTRCSVRRMTSARRWARWVVLWPGWFGQARSSSARSSASTRLSASETGAGSAEYRRPKENRLGAADHRTRKAWLTTLTEDSYHYPTPASANNLPNVNTVMT